MTPLADLVTALGQIAIDRPDDDLTISHAVARLVDAEHAVRRVRDYLTARRTDHTPPTWTDLDLIAGYVRDQMGGGR